MRKPAWRVVAVVAAVVVVAYLALLAWDQEKHTAADGSLQGPYQAWQVGLLALAVGAVAVWAGLRHRWLVAATTASVVLTVVWLVDNVPDDDQGLVLVGGTFVAVGTFVATLVVGAVAGEVRRGRRP